MEARNFTFFNNPFRLDRTFEFERLIDQDGYVDWVGDTHYKYTNNLTNEDYPYLWTKNLSDCLAIGLRYKNNNGKVEKIGLYHSVSEHTTSNESFLKAICDFLQTVEQIHHLEIIISFSQVAYTSISQLDVECIKECFKICCDAIGKDRIPAANFLAVSGSDTFYLTDEGVFGSITDAAKLSLSSIKEKIKELDKTNAVTNKIDTLIEHQSEIHPIKLLQKIKKVAGNHLKVLMEDKTDQTLTTLCMEIVAWDLILNSPTDYLLDQWLMENDYTREEEPHGDADIDNEDKRMGGNQYTANGS